MANEQNIGRAKHIVRNYVKLNVISTDPDVQFETYCVWFAKVLQNWKALVSTTLPDGKYYEVTYNGDKDEAYLDVYVKLDNVRIGR